MGCHAWAVAVVVGVNALVIAGMWLRHGGLANAQGPGSSRDCSRSADRAVRQRTPVLIELLLMSRLSAWLERFVGLDRMAVWHRWNGFVAVWLLVRAHGLHHAWDTRRATALPRSVRPGTSSATTPTS